MQRLIPRDRVLGIPPVDRRMVPGAGIVIAGLASTLLWAAIAGIVALV
jgi:hypothetical protein